MAEGLIVKALSGFYYVNTPSGILECRARGKFRLDGTSPLVGDKVECSTDINGKGRIDVVYERKNWFIRPAVANVDALVFVAANTNPVTDPFLVDRISVIAAEAGCELIVCINKTDIDTADELYNIYSHSGFTAIRTSAMTGEGIDELRSALCGKLSAFTGNSGVGKSSILNSIIPGLNIQTAEVSDRLGRGKHTTRHVELYSIDDSSYIADTPGFASLDVEMICNISREKLQEDFIDFAPYIGKCRFNDCAHMKEPDCAVTEALKNGKIEQSRYSSYQRLYDMLSRNKAWQSKV